MNEYARSVQTQLLRRTYGRGVVDTDIPGWSLRCLQTSSGALDGGARELHAEGVQLLEEHYRHVMTNHYGVAAPESIAFVFPVRMYSEGMFNGRTWNAGEFCVWNTNREFNAIAPPCDLLCLIVDRGMLADYLLQTEHVEVEQSLRNYSFSVSSLQNDPPSVLRLVDLMEASFDGHWDVTTSKAQQTVRQEVLETIAPFVIAQIDGDHYRRGYSCHTGLVRRARDVALSQMDAPLQVGELCRALNVSRRTLQESFQVVLGISPLSYLRTLRLNGARRDLLAGHSVKEVTETWGFWHWSRFSQEYRRLFGELPSATMRRVSPSNALERLAELNTSFPSFPVAEQ